MKLKAPISLRKLPIKTPQTAPQMPAKLSNAAAQKIRAKATAMLKMSLILAVLCLQAHAAVQTFQVTIGASVTQVSTTPVNCQWVVFQNNAAHSMRLGDALTSSTRGTYLASGPGGGTFYQGPIPSAATTNLQQFWVAGTQNDVLDVTCNVL